MLPECNQFSFIQLIFQFIFVVLDTIEDGWVELIS